MEKRQGMTGSQQHWPTELRLNAAKNRLHVAFEDGTAFELSAELLRVHSPSAEVRGHGADERKILGGKAKVMIAAIEPVGNYAVRLVFSDGHSTGIYSWNYLHEVGSGEAALWERYLQDLARLGLTREP
jgi:DUF971 family protein